MTRLIFIHGINNQHKSAEIIQKEWGDALNNGMKNAGLDPIQSWDIECAFYGEQLKKGADLWKKNRGARHRSAATKGDFYDQMSEEVREHFKPRAIVEVTQETILTPENTSSVTGGKSRAANPAASVNLHQFAGSASGARAAKAHKKSLIAGGKFLEMVSPKLVKNLVGIFLEQSIAYLEDKELHDEINNIVVEQLFSADQYKDEPHVVVTHSNGTILSYFLFSKILKDWNIKSWYTIGCPLGARAMQEYLPKPDGYPGSVGTWYNCWDTEDFVAFNTPLTSKTIGIDGIVNLNTFDTKYEDKHSITSYLSHAMLARLIASDLT